MSEVTQKIIAKQKQFADARAKAKAVKENYAHAFAEAHKFHDKFWTGYVKASMERAMSLHKELATALQELDNQVKMAEKIAGDFDMAYPKLVEAEKFHEEAKKAAEVAKKKLDTDKSNKDAQKAAEIAAKALEKAENELVKFASKCKEIEDQAGKPLEYFEQFNNGDYFERCNKYQNALHVLANNFSTASKWVCDFLARS